MKKYLFGALAMPLLFACSDDLIEKAPVAGNDQFAGIEKVDATFIMDEGAKTRMDNGTGWTLANGDLYGFAWMGDGTVIANNPADGNAYQNHNLIQTNGRFEPQTSIYVGKYYIYRPYDKTTVSPQAINFNSLKLQPLAEGYESAKQPWKDLAKSAIVIGDKWTDILAGGRTYGTDPTIWDEPGIGKPYKVFAAVFSNQTGLDLKYEKNNPTFTADKEISGATDIKHTFTAGTAVGAADIYKAEVTLTGAANSFTYAPTVEPNDGLYPQTVGGKEVYHNGDFWADKKNLAAVAANTPGDGFTFTSGAITLNSPDADEDGVLDGISTGENGSKGWFWFNSLPVTAGDGNEGTEVTPVFETSYGTVTVKKDYDADTKYTVKDCAYAGNVESGAMVWHPLANTGDATKIPTVWALTGTEAPNTFINQYGNHKGKFKLTVDFSKGVMNGMHIKDDKHLQKLLKYYLASAKSETGVVLNLDGDANKEFKISKISIALLQTINAGGVKVLVQACATHNNPVKIIVTQDYQADLGLAKATEVPALNNVFAAPTDVYLAEKTNWTWSGGGETADWDDALTIDANVSKLTNEGNLTVDAINVQLSVPTVMLYNAADATMDITKVTTVKNTLHNYGKINVGSESNTTAELRAYGARIYNNATELDAHGVINNYGVVGSTSGTSGEFHNWGLINMMNDDAMTLLKSNEKGTDPFGKAFNKTSNKMGTVVLPKNNPYAIVSVNNAAENGFIKYNWTGDTYTTPAGNVKYNTIVVSDDIAFSGAATEVQYIEFTDTKTQVVSPTGALTGLKGIIVDDKCSIIIEKTNQIDCKIGAYLGVGATVYKGGTFTLNGSAFGSGTVTNYLGTWSTDQIVVWGD